MEAHLELPVEIAPVSCRRAGQIDLFQSERMHRPAFIRTHPHPFAEVVLQIDPQAVFRLRFIAVALGLVVIAQRHPAAFQAAEIERLQIDPIFPVRLAVEVEGVVAAGGIGGAVVDVGIAVDPQPRIGLSRHRELLQQR